MAGWAPIVELASDVASGKVKAGELVEKSVAAIKEKPEFNAVIVTTEKRARARANEIDELVASGKNPGRLAGVPFIAKDNFLVFGAETTAASNILKGFEAPYQASAIEKLEAEGAVCVAKANLDAFAHGSSTENSDFGVTKNPHDETRVPGGSSGGSAAAVALELVPFALGTDTGGSIRLPASFCGVVGYKPTYGLVSRSGVVAMASSLDVVGPLANSVAAAALVLDVLAGQDNLDSTTIERDNTSYTELEINIKDKKIGIIKEYFDDGLDVGVRQKVDAAIEKLKSAGAELVEISLPSSPLALAAYYIICPAEVSSNLMRYDGQRYGLHIADAKNLEAGYVEARTKGFNGENKRRIMIGTHVLSSGYYDAYYRKAQTVRTKLISEMNEAFSKVDFLLGPTAPSTAFKTGENTADPLKMYLTDVLTVTANLTGVPAISLPCGLADNLPVGLQIMAPQRADHELLAAAKATEELLS